MCLSNLTLRFVFCLGVVQLSDGSITAVRGHVSLCRLSILAAHPGDSHTLGLSAGL